MHTRYIIMWLETAWLTVRITIKQEFSNYSIWYTKATTILWCSQKEKKKLAVFSPAVEPSGTIGAFLPDDPRKMLARGDISDVPIMVGYTTHEGLLQLGGK